MGEVETALYGAARAREEAARRAAAAEKAAKREAERARAARAREWGDEEVRLLEKALDRFPQARRLRLCGSVRVMRRGRRPAVCACLAGRRAPGGRSRASSAERGWLREGGASARVHAHGAGEVPRARGQWRARVAAGHGEAVGPGGGVRAHTHGR